MKIILRILSKKMYEQLDCYGLYNSTRKESKGMPKEAIEDAFWKGFIYAGISINKRSIYVCGYKAEIDMLAKYIDKLGVAYRRRCDTGIIIEKKKDIKRLIEDCGYDFIKTFIQEYVDSLDKEEKHSWSFIFTNKRRPRN